MNIPPPNRVWPAPLIVPWQRFSCGLWRMPEGDISAAYSANRLPRVRMFQHEGVCFTCLSLAGRAFQQMARCYPLIALADYNGPEPVERSYEGSEVLFRKQPHRLGSLVTFIASDPGIHEWRRLLRVLYADGGAFVSGKTYAQMLDERAGSEHVTGSEQEAIRLELPLSDLPRTQAEMKARLLSRDPFATTANPTQLQLSL